MLTLLDFSFHAYFSTLTLPCLLYHLPHLLGNGTTLLTLFALLRPSAINFENDILDPLEEKITSLAFQIFWRGGQLDNPTVCNRKIWAWCGRSDLVIAKAWLLLEPNLPEHAIKNVFSGV